MSLKVWLPLNKNIANKGNSNINFSIVSNNTTTSTGGKIGNCYTNNSFTDGGLVSDKIIDLGQKQSMFCWFKFTTLNNASSLGGGLVTQHRYPSNSGMGITIKYISSTTGYLSVNTGNGSSRTYNTYCGTTLLQANRWYHGGYTYDGTTLKIYVNGVCEKTQTISNMYIPADYLAVFCWSFNSSSIGTNNTILSNYKLNGSLNDIRIYDHCLSELEIKELAKGLAVHYKLDDLSSGKLIDSTGYSTAGTKSGTITQNSTSPRGTNSLAFAAGSYISAPIAASGFTNTYTFSWWGKYTNYSGHMMWGFQNGNRLNLYMASGNFYWNIGDGTQNPFNVSAATYGDGNWHHFAVTGDGTSSLLYIDGIYRGTAKTFRPITGTTLIFNGWDTSGSYKFNGSLSDFRLYSTCLTADDIKSLYEIGAKIDKQNTIHTYEINEDDSEGIKSNIKKSGIVKTKTISNYLVNGFDEQVYCEPDGSLWIKIFHHNNPNAYLFSSTDSFTTNVYKDVNRWFRVALCNYLTDTWEFIVEQKLTSSGAVSRFRWQQNVNPMVATYSEVASANITKINTGYTALSSAHGGIYNASTNPSTSGKSYILANNGTSGNWFGNVGGWTAYQSGIPGFNNTVVTTGYIDLYLRVDNISELNRVLIGKDFIASDNFIEI